MDIIHLLPDSVANQIAAGEVIQRPASCLKELVENSLDAGADDIQIIISDAGRTLIQVIDNGKGMSPTDARMAFERHATSKISNAADLFNLHTMGFRGEALASIAAVAQVEVLTRRQEDELGTLIEIASSKVIRQEPAQTQIGTIFKVKNLFYNVPARRRFLKTNNTELRNLINEFYRIALVYPKVHFMFVNEDEILFDLPSGSLKQRIDNVFGKLQKHSLATQLVDIKTDTAIVNICGFIGTPESASKNAQQYFFVNGRFMKHPYFHKAVMTAYQGTLQNEHNPHYFIYFDVNPDAIDINIHPTKTEIKFADEQSIWQILLSTIRTSLGKFNLTPSLDFNREGEIEIHSINPQKDKIKVPTINLSDSYNPFDRQKYSQYKPVQGWEELYQTPQSNDAQVTQNIDKTEDFKIFEDTYDAFQIFQYKEKYICITLESGLLLLDQQRLHGAVLYYQYLKQLNDQKGVKQQVLFPEIIDLSEDDTQLLTSITDKLESVGFEITQIAKISFSIDSVPALLSGQNAMKVVLEIIHTIKEQPINSDELYKRTIALGLAKESSIKYGKVLSEIEMRDLVKQWSNLSSKALAPDGKRIANLISDEYINKLFN